MTMTPTTEGKQLAAETVTITREAWEFLFGQGPLDGAWFNDTHPTKPGGYWWRPVIRASHVVNEPDTVLKAQLEEALADLREIDRLMCAPNWGSRESDRAVATIAAKYRVVTDLLLIEARTIIKNSPEYAHCHDGIESGRYDHWTEMRIVLAALKRGFEIGGKS